MRIAILVLISSFLLAQDAAAASELKLAYVDMARALNEVEEGKAAKQKLKSDFKKKQKRLDELQNQLKAKQAEFEKRKAMMKEEVRQARLEEMQRDFVELQQTYGRLQRELMEEENKITQEIGSRIAKIVAKVGDRDSYTLILNIGDTVLYHKRHQDITDEVVRLYNKQYRKK